jgi:hypothetical protein
MDNYSAAGRSTRELRLVLPASVDFFLVELLSARDSAAIAAVTDGVSGFFCVLK